METMAARLRRAPDLFRPRKALAEHPFGTMKRGMDQAYFLLKTLRKVRGEYTGLGDRWPCRHRHG